MTEFKNKYCNIEILLEWFSYVIYHTCQAISISDCKGIHAEQQDFSTWLAPFTAEEELV